MAEQTQIEKAKASQDEALAKAQEAQNKINARIEELKQYVGKTFKRKDGTYPHQTIKILRYEGLGTLAGGVIAYLYRVESKNPGGVWTPPATKFLEEHVEVAVEQPKEKEVI